MARGPAGGARARRPTIDDVAERASVSRGTVSRALNGGHHVSPSTLQAVKRAVREIGYTPNESARRLRMQRANSVAFVLNEPQTRLFEDPNFATILGSCTDALADHDIPLMLMTAANQGERERVSRFLRGGHADGVLLVSTHAGDPIIDMLLDERVPLVTCGKPLGHDTPIAYVGSDDRDGAAQMARHLRDRGRERIAMITSPMDTTGGVERLAGFRDVLPDTPNELIEQGDFSWEAGEQAMTRLLDRVPNVDAVFVCNDVAAAAAIDVVVASGRRVPDDVAIGGYDDAPLARRTQPPLTTIRQPFKRIASEMVRLLLEAIDGSDPAACVLPNELVVRGST